MSDDDNKVILNVVSLMPGENRPPEGLHDAGLVKFIENLKLRVQRGEITALAYCSVERNGSVSRGWYKAREDCWRLAGAILTLAHDYPHEHQE